MRRRSPAATASTASAGRAIPAACCATFAREYPFGWLGILAAVAPSSDELVYAHHERGFALLSLRSPELVRLYLQCAPDEDLAEWPDERIWEELQHAARARRLDAARGADPREGRDRHAQLRRRADAARPPLPRRRRGAHRPADGREGAQPRDRGRRACSPRRSSPGTATGSETCSTRTRDACLRRVWRAEHFSWWMTSMLHRLARRRPVRPRAAALAAALRDDAPRRRHDASPRTTSGSRPSEPDRSFALSRPRAADEPADDPPLRDHVDDCEGRGGDERSEGEQGLRPSHEHVGETDLDRVLGRIGQHGIRQEEVRPVSREAEEEDERDDGLGQWQRDPPERCPLAAAVDPRGVEQLGVAGRLRSRGTRGRRRRGRTRRAG